ncbi:MAG: fibronectin type III domain-containing protein, partial [Candidatus Marinimicrobia bacterium]|nr:fibronectin type III domain-containing protein [Candidatus Neomarinimicrobiota bacterium]
MRFLPLSLFLISLSLGQVAGPTLQTPSNGATDIDPTSSITLNWSNVTNVGYYELHVEDNSSFSNPDIDENVSPSIYYISANTLNYSTTYYWRVRGHHTSGPWNGWPTLWSDTYSFTTASELDITPPDLPTGLTATPGDTQISLTWTANTESDLASYKVYGGTSAGPTTLLSTVSAGTETYIHTGLTYGTTYYYRISAVDDSGNESDKTSDVSASPIYSGPTFHVSTDGSDDNDGSEENPFASIQTAIDSSSNSDTVLVQAGTYTENINFNGKNIVVGSNMLVTSDTSYISSTIIDGNEAG